MRRHRANGRRKHLLTSAGDRAKHVYVTFSDNVKDHPFRSLGLLTIGMSLLSSYLLWNHYKK